MLSGLVIRVKETPVYLLREIDFLARGVIHLEAGQPDLLPCLSRVVAIGKQGTWEQQQPKACMPCPVCSTAMHCSQVLPPPACTWLPPSAPRAPLQQETLVSRPRHVSQGAVQDAELAEFAELRRTE